ncbi:TetR/AcrR family transcriptional regulator [Arthrobacter bambusae]|uniref:TetR/AcrR family transcriptional regulator n=1 Tax=Arthrobacter bambusae TaxID=1338426 RepID=UPI00278046F3|nr:TetR family transcriptional regulator C-terminal domain-containing protein [Arthrobacter bambusae]MDQ0212778.1 AcrR family transcriptional regulator [Arthrobacter bambusae]MDQ0233750.1 AcrR family transcriptional regulator [Arthrobacter bambusae]
MPKIVDAEARRQEVVEAVFRIIASDGLERASLREVADEAGLAVGSVRHYFASSDELLVHSFAVVIDRIAGRLDEAFAVVESLDNGSAEHDAAVLTLLGQFLPLDEELAVDACVWMAFRHAARIRPVLEQEAARSHRAVAAVVGRLMMRLMPVGRLMMRLMPDGGSGQERLVAEAERLLATLDGLCMHALLQPEWMTAEVCRDVLTAHVDSLVAVPSNR